MKKLKSLAAALWFSLPLQLLFLQLRQHKLILLQWLVLFLAVCKGFGVSMGIPYLFLEPEYMGEVGFNSLFLLGCGTGAFIAAFQIATYIQDAYQFHFLVLERRPFLVFFLNNSLLPFAFVSVFSWQFVQFQMYLNEGFQWRVLLHLGGFYLGLALVLSLLVAYFRRAHKNIFNLMGERFVQDELQSRRVILNHARLGVARRNRVDVYLPSPVRIARPDPALGPDFRGVVKLLNQHHGHALFVQLIFIGAIVGLGLLERHSAFQAPAGVSVLLFFSILLLLTSAFTFWFRKLGPLVLVALVGLYVLLDQNDVFRHRHQALGMDYETQPAVYNADRLFDLTALDTISNDLDSTRAVLERWKARMADSSGRPRMVLICASGGGLRASYFTFRCLQQLDSLTAGTLLQHTRLITGASGGMIGAAYFRELDLLRQQGKLNGKATDREYARRISLDLLNRISFKMVSGLFFTSGRVQIGSHSYPADRGWSFDDQLMRNLGAFENRRLGEYARWERAALTPMLVLSPVVMNDGRKLIISPLPASWMCRTLYHNGLLARGITGIELRRLFSGQAADSLLFSTALRMNASFPLITPYVQLPSQPPLSVIDAGIADNLGIQSAAKFIYLFHDWIAKNTRGVLIVQIRDSETRATRAPKFRKLSLLEELLDPIGTTYTSFALSKDIASEDYLNMAQAWLPGKLEMVSLEYARTDSAGIKASLSWHLTRREKMDLELSLDSEGNREAFEKITSWLAAK